MRSGVMGSPGCAGRRNGGLRKMKRGDAPKGSSGPQKRLFTELREEGGADVAAVISPPRNCKRESSGRLMREFGDSLHPTRPGRQGGAPLHAPPLRPPPF